MRESILLPGMLGALACILSIGPMPTGAMPISREYNQILIPGDIIEGWHQAGENYYKFERRLLIGQDHPYDRYSSAKLSWPEEEKSPYTISGRITFFKCINRTPNNARVLMNVIHGGTGTPELVLNVIYTPLRFVIINTMIITCDIYYTRDNDVVKIDESFGIRNPLDNERPTTKTRVGNPTSYHTTPRIITTINSSGEIDAKETTSSTDTKSTIQISNSRRSNLQTTSSKPGRKLTPQSRKVDSMNRRTTKSRRIGKKLSEIGTTERIDRSRSYYEDKIGRTDKITTTIGKEIDEETGRRLSKGKKEMNETILKANRTSVKMDRKESPEIGINRINLGEEKTVLTTIRTTSKIADTKFVDKSSRGGETTVIPCFGTSPDKRNTSNLCNNGTSGIKSIENRKNDDETKRISLRGEKTSPWKEKTRILEVTSPKTIGSTPQESFLTTPMMDETSSRHEKDESSEEGEEIIFRCRITSLGTNKTNFNANRTSLKNADKDKKNRDDETTTKEENTIEKPTSSSGYNLVVKITPTGSRRKIGLAKITYR